VSNSLTGLTTGFALSWKEHKHLLASVNRWSFAVLIDNIAISQWENTALELVTLRSCQDLTMSLARVSKPWQSKTHHKSCQDLSQNFKHVHITPFRSTRAKGGGKIWKSSCGNVFGMKKKNTRRLWNLTSRTYQKIDQSHDIDPCIDNTFHFLDWWLR